MRCSEHEGKEMLARCGIAIPRGGIASTPDVLPVVPPVVVKAQVLAGERGRAGGIRIARTDGEARGAIQELVGSCIRGERVECVRVEEFIDAVTEYYVSFSYDTATRGPVLAVARNGGIAIEDATIVPVPMTTGVSDTEIAAAFKREEIPSAHHRAFADTIRKLWACFTAERALLIEINPLFMTVNGRAIAGDAKVVRDDDVVHPHERRFLSLGGDIAILASGGGASLLNVDALLAHGGKPANYTEYSGNPSADAVRDLTARVLSQPNLRGCWVVGGTANFTDIYETMRGFVEGLRLVQPKPTYPIVIRRDGPRQAEAFTMLRTVAAAEGYQFYCFNSETPMEESARVMVKLAYG